jgi:hypothetical protein
VRGEQLAVDLAHGGEVLARLGEGFLELEGALLGVLELCAQLALAVDGELVVVGEVAGDLLAEQL